MDHYKARYAQHWGEDGKIFSFLGGDIFIFKSWFSLKIFFGHLYYDMLFYYYILLRSFQILAKTSTTRTNDDTPWPISKSANMADMSSLLGPRRQTLAKRQEKGFVPIDVGIGEAANAQLLLLMWSFSPFPWLSWLWLVDSWLVCMEGYYITYSIHHECKCEY